MDLTSKERNYMQRLLEKFDFVKWDRYSNPINGNFHEINVFGWIDRDDSYKDFVLLSVIFSNPISIWNFTSSAKYSKAVSDIVLQSHSDCERVEYAFDLKNMIKLPIPPAPKGAGILGEI